MSPLSHFVESVVRKGRKLVQAQSARTAPSERWRPGSAGPAPGVGGFQPACSETRRSALVKWYPVRRFYFPV